MSKYGSIIAFIMILLLFGCEKKESNNESLELLQVFIGSEEISINGEITTNLPVDRPIALVFSQPLYESSINNSIVLKSGEEIVDADISLSSQNNSVSIYPEAALENNTIYTIEISGSLQDVHREFLKPINISFKTILGNIDITSLKIKDEYFDNVNIIKDVPLDLSITIHFSNSIDTASFEKATNLSGPGVAELLYVYSDENTIVNITSSASLKYLSKYIFSVSNSLTGAKGESFSGLTQTIYTQLDSSYKFPEISDEELLTLIQEQTFKYFWDFGHPVSGLSRERNTSGDVVTSGGSGFGIMSVIVGIERGFISRSEGIERMGTIVDFLAEADRFHGAWPHWLNGSTGEVIPFSSNDDGGDLVETSYLAMGLITFRQYLKSSVSQENIFIEKINSLLSTIEWDWYTQGENSLTWHWSPNYDFEKNHKIRGWNEALITYVMAASSETHPISGDVYKQGWAQSSTMENGKQFYGITLPLGPDYGGPLFFEQYSFLGLDPGNLSDQYADYWQQAVNHSLINHEYCKTNPLDYIGYSNDCWGLTASDGDKGYSAHSPTNDKGVISPTAAVSSIPFTPEESMKAIKHFYYMLGDRLWGPYGFYDAFNITNNWYATSNIAIDQGPMILMIENYRTGLLWRLFMSAPEVENGLNKLEFSY